ncbi:hypothetical protein FRC19_009715 [Serendipita sp. 401]|nr:hypothetical protein FRC19_009715 [Serendipita sp. 401]
MASNNPSPTIPYEPVATVDSANQYPPSQPTDFGPPRPGFFNATSHSTMSSTTTLDVRSSTYSDSYGKSKQNGDLYLDSPSESDAPGARGLGGSGAATGGSGLEKAEGQVPLYGSQQTNRRRPKMNCVTKLIIIVCALLLLAVAVFVPLWFFVLRDKLGHGGHSSSSSSSNHNSNNGANSGTTATNNGDEQHVVTTGGDGSLVTKDDGSTFMYNNTFGGFWVLDPSNPLNESAQAQSWTKPLSQQWQWGVDKMYGVNLGGWLTLEPFISPALYEEFYPDAVDEWTLSEHLQAKYNSLDVIENHYKTFIVEEDFAQIAAAGLNWVRIPIPFWAIQKYDNEPFLERTAWTYFLKAIEWARKYGIRINLDFHALPGSQNGWNHSGKLGLNGEFNFMRGVMGIANAQRAMDYIRILAEFISQPEYKNVVPFFGIVNEPLSNIQGSYPKSAMEAFYAEAYRVIRNAGGTGAGNGPMISIHHAFWGPDNWTGFLQGSDRIAMDLHPYLVFPDGPADPDPASSFPAKACAWAAEVATSMTNFGLTGAGEWSHAINDCGLYVNEVGKGTRYEGTYKTTSWQAGGDGAGGNVVGLDAYPWPPAAIGGFADASTLPRYTPTGPIITMPVKTYTATAQGSTSTINVGDGWTNDADTTLMAVPAAGCDYPNQWDALTAAVPTC